MPQDFNTALVLLAVGMTTVFVILSLVVLSGRLLIRLVNAYAPEPLAVRTSAPVPLISSNEPNVSPAVVAAIVATVDHITGGKGKVQKIEKEH